MIWHVLCQRKLFGDFSIDNHYIEAIEKYLNYVYQEFNWEDLLNILRVARGEENSQIESRMNASLVHGFEKLLNIDSGEAAKLVKILR